MCWPGSREIVKGWQIKTHPLGTTNIHTYDKLNVNPVKQLMALS